MKKIFNNIFKIEDNNYEYINIDNFDFARQENGKTNMIKNILLKISKFIIVFSFAPIILVFYLFNNKQFSKIFKQVIIILYFIFFAIFIYTVINQNKKIVANIEIIESLNYKNKIKSFK